MPASDLVTIRTRLRNIVICHLSGIRNLCEFWSHLQFWHRWWGWDVPAVSDLVNPPQRQSKSYCQLTFRAFLLNTCSYYWNTLIDQKIKSKAQLVCFKWIIPLHLRLLELSVSKWWCVMICIVLNFNTKLKWMWIIQQKPSFLHGFPTKIMFSVLNVRNIDSIHGLVHKY